MFDWHNRFHKFIEQHEKKKDDSELNKILEQKTWKE